MTGRVAEVLNVVDSVTPDEAKFVSDEIKRVPGIIAYSSKELQRLPVLGLRDDRGSLLSVIFYKPHRSYVDLKIMLTFSQQRYCGHGEKLLGEFLLKFSSQTIYVASRNPVLIKKLLKSGFVTTSLRRTPPSLVWSEFSKALSLYRVKEYVRKLSVFPEAGKFQYFVRNSAESDQGES